MYISLLSYGDSLLYIYTRRAPMMYMCSTQTKQIGRAADLRPLVMRELFFPLSLYGKRGAPGELIGK